MIATILFCVCILSTIGFQIALLLGAPWGRLTQGGQVDGPGHAAQAGDGALAHVEGRADGRLDERQDLGGRQALAQRQGGLGGLDVHVREGAQRVEHDVRHRLDGQLEVHEGECERGQAEEHLVKDGLPDDQVHAAEHGAVQQQEDEQQRVEAALRPTDLETSSSRLDMG